MKWDDVFIGDLNFDFAIEIIVRTLIMFSMVLIVLRLSGKKGVRQLSLFEVAIIIGLGSAAGDPMFNKETSILQAIVVFVTIILLYRLITFFAGKSEFFESIVEGDPIYVIENGEFLLKESGDHTFAKDEFFSEMRQQSIAHVGQVKTAILETTGNISFYYYHDEEVGYGLPVQPKLYAKKLSVIDEPDVYACSYCARPSHLEKGKNRCPRCNRHEWVLAINDKRLN